MASTRRTLIVAIGSLFISTAVVPASGQYYVTIDNGTPYTLSYNLNGQLYQLASGAKQRHNKSTPGFSVSFDWDITPKQQIQQFALHDHSYNKFGITGVQLGLYRIGQDALPQQTEQQSQRPLVQSRELDITSDKYVSSTATLYPSGQMVIQAYTWCGSYTSGLHCWLFVVCRDQQSRVLWVTRQNKCTTRGSRGDWFTDSSGTDVFRHNLPPVVAQRIRSMDIYYYDYDNTDDLRQIVNNVKRVAQAYQDLPAPVKAAIASGMVY